MVRTLVHKQLLEIFRSYFYNAKTGKARSKAVTAVYILLFVLLMVGLLGGVFTMLALLLCGELAAVGADWFYFALIAVLASLFGILGSVFNTYASLYLAKDNDLLLSMPIPTGVIMFSRLLTVYLMGLMYSITILLPAILVYWITVDFSPAVFCGGLILVLLVSVFVLLLSCGLGWVVARISLKLKRKSFLTVLISLLFFGAYYYFCFRWQALITGLLTNADAYAAAVRSGAYPLYAAGQAAAGHWGFMAIDTAAMAALLVITWRLLSRSFLAIATSSAAVSKAVYREQTARVQSPARALLRKELLRFTASPTYMLNCGLGVVILPLAAVFLVWKGGSLLELLPELLGPEEAGIPVLLSAAACAMAAMNDMTAPAVSLEGKCLWLLRSLPVTPWQILQAKLRLQLLLTAPAVLVFAAAIRILFPLTIWQLLLTALVPLLFTVLSALLGLFLGLKMPNLTWTSEITPIKQSMAVLLTLLAGFGWTLLMVFGWFWLGSRLGMTGYLAAAAAAAVLLSAILYIWLRGKGTRLLADL